MSATWLTTAGIVLAIVLTGAGILVARKLYDLEIRGTERSLVSLTTLLSEQADRSMQAMEVIQLDVARELSSARSSADRSLASLGSSTAMHDKLRASVSALPQVKEISIVDLQGRTINSSIDRPADDELSRPSFLEDLGRDPAGRKIIVAGTARPDGSGLDLIVAHRILDTDGRSVGYMIGAVDLRYFERLYARVSPDEADVISFVHTDLTMLARHPRPPGAIGRKVPPLKWMRVEGAERPTSGVERMTTPIDGQDRIVAAQLMEHYPIIMGTSRTISATLTPWRAQTLPLTATVALLVGGVFFIVRIAKAQLRAQERLASSSAAQAAAEERASADRRLRDEYARFGTALDSMSQGVLLLNHESRLVVLNARMTELFDIPPILREAGSHLDVLLRQIIASMTKAEGDRLSDVLAASARESRSAALVCDLTDGRIVGVTTATVPNGGIVCTFEDITERHRAQAMITHMAHHDALTGLPNRVLLQEATGRLLAERGRTSMDSGALLLLDLDGFKQVNDVHGHPLGDALLRAVAVRLSALIDDPDVLARLGGDEFAVVRFGRDEEGDAVRLAECIVSALGIPFVIEGVHLSIGTSIGVALVDVADGSSETLLRNADIALYRAKASGRRTWCLYQPQMECENRERRRLETDLGCALEKGQLELHYQPIVEAASRAVIGYEALLRWRHPTRGLVPPAEFIPICEEIGLIHEIGSWVLHHACEDAAGWLPGLRVAVNLSAVQFREKELVAVVERALACSGLPAKLLELEITESVLLRDDLTNLEILKALHRMGVSIVMDDFGTGYSSLNYMRCFPFDKIKIDQTFVRNLSNGSQGVAVMRAAIALGHALGITVLAEGIETDEERDFLVDEGCDELQGYLFGRPERIDTRRRSVDHHLHNSLWNRRSA